jgi:Nucleoside-diphosphate-sugar epimerases
MKVLVTGSEGSIGRVVVRGLAAAGHSVRGLDFENRTDGQRELITGSITDPDDVARAMKGMDTVIHLAAVPDDADFIDVLLEPNVVGPYRIFEGAVKAGVQRVVVASSIQVSSPWDSEGESIRVEDTPFLNNHYALTKLWVEDMALFYSQRRNLSTIAVRIGWFPRELRNIEDNPLLSVLTNWYLSQRDAAEFFKRCVESDQPAPGESAVLFAVGKQQHAPFFDLSLSESIIGYTPRDTFPENLTFG